MDIEDWKHYLNGLDMLVADEIEIFPCKELATFLHDAPNHYHGLSDEEKEAYQRVVRYLNNSLPRNWVNTFFQISDE